MKALSAVEFAGKKTGNFQVMRDVKSLPATAEKCVGFHEIE
jgi:hypothetical protein